MEEMPDKENEPLAANAPAPEAPATDAPAAEAPAPEAPATDAPAPEAPATDAPAADALAIDTTPAGASATEATDAAPKPKLTKSQRKKKDRERLRAARPKPIDTPQGAIVSVRVTGKVGRVTRDNSKNTTGDHQGWVEITDSTGEGSEGWFRPGELDKVEQKEQDAFEKKEKESGGEPYYLGGDDDASESDGDEPLDEPPVAKEVKVEELQKTNLRDLLRYVEGPKDARGRKQRAAAFAAVLADTSDEKADERAALIASTDAVLKKAWTKYEKHQEKYPGLYPEVEPVQAPKDYSDVDIDHVKLSQYVKDTYRKQIQECVAEHADLSSVEAKASNDICKGDFLKALRDARGESRDEQRSPRLAGKEAPPLPTTSNAGQSLTYTDSSNSNLITDQMVDDARALVKGGTLVPAVGAGGRAMRGGFSRGVGTGSAFRLVGVPGPSFSHRYDHFAVYEDDPVGAMLSSLRIDLAHCYEPLEGNELEPRLVYESNFALESLPDGASVKDRAKAVYEACYWVVEKHEHEAVQKSTFKAPGLFHTG